MAFIVEMVGGVEGASWHFCCGEKVWEQVLQLADEHGWRSLGTKPDPLWKHVWDEWRNFVPNYECEDWGKTVSADDAAALADALKQASQHPLPALPKGPVLLREGMTANECRRASAELDADFLEEFVAFLRKGEFSFYWDD
jgi:hypothetical protein